MEIKPLLISELEKALQLPYIPGKTIGQFNTFIMSRDNLLRADNVHHHVCSFFLPVHLASRSVYLVYHIKANDWIPPGGHIDPGETPIDTIKREYAEELSFKITDQPVTLVNLTVKHIRNPRHPCLTHYDFWYTVEMNEMTDFTFDKGEFYEAGWFPLDEGLKKMKLPLYRKAVTDSLVKGIISS